MALRRCIAEVHVKQPCLSDLHDRAGPEWCEDPCQPHRDASQNNGEAYGDEHFLEARSLGGFLTSVPNDFRVDRSIPLPSVAWRTARYWLAR